MEVEFTLKYRLSVNNANHDELVERLYEVGCDDALVGLGVPGQLGLEFIREASSAEDAIISALADVKRAIPDAQLIEVGPDLVGLTDVADLLEMSRQNMRKVMLKNPEKFPVPVHIGNSSIWHLAPVLQFLKEENYLVSQPLIDVSFAAMRLNIEKESTILSLCGHKPERSVMT